MARVSLGFFLESRDWVDFGGNLTWWLLSRHYWEWIIGELSVGHHSEAPSEGDSTQMPNSMSHSLYSSEFFPKSYLKSLLSALPWDRWFELQSKSASCFTGLIHKLLWWNGLLWWLSGKEHACQWGRHRFNPWVKKILWRRKWQPTPVFQAVFCLGNPMDRVALWATVHGVAKSQTWLSDSAHTHIMNVGPRLHHLIHMRNPGPREVCYLAMILQLVTGKSWVSTPVFRVTNSGLFCSPLPRVCFYWVCVQRWPRILGPSEDQVQKL